MSQEAVFEVEGTLWLEQFIRTPVGGLVDLIWSFNFNGVAYKKSYLLTLSAASNEAGIPVPDWLGTQIPEDLVSGYVLSCYHWVDGRPVPVPLVCLETFNPMEKSDGCERQVRAQAA